MLFKKHTRSYLPFFTGAFVGILLISEVAAVKVVQLGDFIVPGAVILFPFSYIIGDVLTEVYGYARARRVIWTGFIMALVMVLCFEAVGRLPAAPFWEGQAAWDTILGYTPRIVFASLIAYLAGEFSNSFVLAKMKVKSKGKNLWQRTIGSTIVGQGVDTILFISIAFWGTITPETVVAMIGAQYVIKVLIEAAMTPATYKVVHFLKKAEKMDVYDSKTNFSPFHFG